MAEQRSPWYRLLLLAAAAACGSGLTALFSTHNTCPTPQEHSHPAGIPLAVQQALLQAQQKCHNGSALVNSTGFYLHQTENDFLKHAREAVTDKVTTHSYEFIYGKYFEMLGRRNVVVKLLEIGLGCNMDYGPGHSAGMWRKYMPQADIWMAEFDAKCVEKHQAALDAMGVHVLVGDQANVQTLRGWVARAGGKQSFDVIIDDGGHSNMQMFNSFMVLFFEALKPGGVYVVEDLQCARIKWFIDGDRQHVFNNVIRDWVEGLAVDGNVQDQDPVLGYKPKFKIPPRIKSIECSSGVCAITKCYDDDTRCTYPFTDATLPGSALSGAAGRR